MRADRKGNPRSLLVRMPRTVCSDSEFEHLKTFISGNLKQFVAVSATFLVEAKCMQSLKHIIPEPLRPGRNGLLHSYFSLELWQCLNDFFIHVPVVRVCHMSFKFGGEPDNPADAINLEALRCRVRPNATDQVSEGVDPVDDGCLD